MMVLERSDALEAAQRVKGLSVRQLEPEEASLHALVAASGFEAPEELFLQLMTAEVLHRPGVRCYMGEVDDVPVVTGLGVTMGESVGIFNIATPPQYRGHGFGAAVTARAVADGLDSGACWSFLQSSPAGYGVYAHLGYVTAELWDLWAATP